MLTITGRYQRGIGAASETTNSQLPLISPGFPEIKDCHTGTINVVFESMIIVAGCDHRTSPIPWCGEDDGEGEVFDFLRVRLRFPDLSDQLEPAWMYIAHWSPHRMDPHNHEFLTRYIDGLRLGMTLIMECDRAHMELPYLAYSQPDPLKQRLNARTYVIQ